MSTLSRPYALPINPPDRRSPGWMVMVLIIATEAMLFAYLLFSYFYLASSATGKWPPSGPPDLTLVIPNTVILLVSSGCIWWGERGLRLGSRRRLVIGLVATLVLGVAFLSIQGVEYAHKTFHLATNAYSSLFFTITGLHGTHVFIGLLMVAIALVRTLCGHFTPERHLAVTNTAMYWHFVDAVWLVVFTALYLSPYIT
jgi:heme/copper-type cytochrome/quinol oxidase subunit 3